MTNNDTTERDLGRVEGKLDLVITLLTKGDEKHSKLADRVTALEKRVLASVLLSGAGASAYVFDAKHLLMGLFQ